MCKTLRILRALVSMAIGRRAARKPGLPALSPRYYYTVWIRHLCLAHQNGLPVVPRVIVELGPGGALGMAAAAMLCGVETYTALDALPLASLPASIEILHGVEQLLQARAGIPDDTEFPRVRPRLNSYSFPHNILTDEHLKIALSPERVRRIEQCIRQPDGTRRGNESVRYLAPWRGPDPIQEASVNAVLTQAVMEYVPDLAAAYRAMWRWLEPGGWMSHTIDVSSHGTADAWDGHWAYSDWQWRLLHGRAVVPINRRPYSDHRAFILDAGFRVICESATQQAAMTPQGKLAQEFGSLTAYDRQTSGCTVQAVKP